MTRLSITFIVLLMALTSMSSHAQEVSKDEIAGIRAAYQAAKEQVALNDQAQEQDVPRSDMEIVSHYIVPGCGPTEEVIHYYFSLDEDPVLGTPVYNVYMITRSYNVAARKYYQEFIFDGPEYNLQFFYQRNDALDGGTDEIRYYYGKNGIHKNIKGTADLDEVFAARLASELTGAFNLLMNKDY